MIGTRIPSVVIARAIVGEAPGAEVQKDSLAIINTPKTIVDMAAKAME